MANVNMEIDGKAVQAAQGTTVLEAARSIGVKIPTLCDDDRLEAYGGCRMCVVEIETRSGRREGNSRPSKRAVPRAALSLNRCWISRSISMN